MTSLEIESWTIRVVTRLIAGQSKEDSLVEFKTKLPEPKRAARWIAGHANAARAESILWVLGVDENECKLSPLPPSELSAWWPQVKSIFDEVFPGLQHQFVDVCGGTVHALVFDCTRLPFVVKNQKTQENQEDRGIDREVPWRDGTSTRSAHRSNLIEILAPVVMLPRLDVLLGNFRTETISNTSYRTTISVMLYIVPRVHQHVVFPHHSMSVTYEQDGHSYKFQEVKVEVPRRQSPWAAPGTHGIISGTITESSAEIIVRDPGKVRIEVSGEVPFVPLSHMPVTITVNMGEAFSQKTATVSSTFVHHHGSAQDGYWEAKV